MEDDRKYGNTSRVRITIPGFRRIQNDIGKAYTVYKVVIAKPGGQKEIEKRYNEFYILNKTLKDNQHLPHGQIHFPPKRLNTSVATKEERRKKLERYLQVLCVQDPIAPEVLSFLGISQPLHPLEAENYNSSCEDLLAISTNSTHQPIMGFPTDPFAPGQESEPSTTTRNILLDGILDGLYGNVYTVHHGL